MLQTLLPLLALVPVLAMPQAAPRLESLRGRVRVLLIFAPSERDLLFQQQDLLLQHHDAELKDRDLVVIPVLAKVVTAKDGETPSTLQAPLASEAEQVAVRHRFHVIKDRFTVILIGKDGDEKLRRNQPLTAAQIKAVVDAMPMRQGEMRRKGQR